MSEKSSYGQIPQSYVNLGFDSEPVAGPSAPVINAVDGDYAASSQPVVGPSAPQQEDSGKYEESPGPPPAPSAPTFPATPTTEYLTYSSPTLAFEDVYEACMKYVGRHCCYSSRFVRQMKLTDINNGYALHYTLESYGEKRESGYRYCPYRGGSIDGPENGRPPDPWDIYVRLPDLLFKDSKTETFIPHTDFVETCYKCDGSGHTRCYSCSGDGWETCSYCSGSGRDSEDEQCSSCSGRGRKTCWNCSGSGTLTCSRCDGYGQVKGYKVLFVSWINHKQDFISEIYKLPKDRIRKITADILYHEEGKKVLPIVNAPDVSVNVASTRLVEAHRISFPAEVIRKQKHYLRGIPFTRVQYEWKETTGEFYIYGKDKEVYFEDYPQKCCCCICC